MSKEQYMFRQRMKQLAVYVAMGIGGVVLVTAAVMLAGRMQ